MTAPDWTLRARSWWRQALDNRLMVDLRPMAIRLIEKLILLQAAFRGLDYILLPDDRPVAALSVIERGALPLAIWGSLFLGAALLAYAGMWWKQSPNAAFGHMGLAILYGPVFGFGALVEVINRDDDGGFFGWRTGTAWVVAGFIHLIYAREAERTWRVERGT